MSRKKKAFKVSGSSQFDLISLNFKHVTTGVNKLEAKTFIQFDTNRP